MITTRPRSQHRAMVLSNRLRQQWRRASRAPLASIHQLDGLNYVTADGPLRVHQTTSNLLDASWTRTGRGWDELIRLIKSRQWMHRYHGAAEERYGVLTTWMHHERAMPRQPWVRRGCGGGCLMSPLRTHARTRTGSLMLRARRDCRGPTTWMRCGYHVQCNVVMA